MIRIREGRKGGIFDDAVELEQLNRVIIHESADFVPPISQGRDQCIEDS